MTIVEAPNAPRLALAGDVDIGIAGQLRALGSRLAERLAPGEVLEIDVAAVTFIDSSGLGALIAVRNATRAAGGQVALVNASKPVARMLELAGLSRTFQMVSVTS